MGIANTGRFLFTRAVPCDGTMGDTPEDPTTQELRIAQGERETASHEAAERADTNAEEKQHKRRAEKSAYLREKLEERERSERDPRR